MKRSQLIKQGSMWKRSVSRAVFGIFLTAAGMSHATDTAVATDEKEPVAESMRRFSNEIIVAYERRDAATLKSFYARQPDAIFFWERKMSYSWPQISETMDALVSAVATLKITTSEFRSGGSGNNGWFAATFHIDRVTPAGKHLSSDGRWTVIAEKVNGHWLIVHEHTSFPLPET